MARWKSAILQLPVFTYKVGLVVHHHAFEFDHKSIQMRCLSLETPPEITDNGGSKVCRAMRSPLIERRCVCVSDTPGLTLEVILRKYGQYHLTRDAGPAFEYGLQRACVNINWKSSGAAE